MHYNTLCPAFRAAASWAQARNSAFRVVTERDIRGGLLDNAKRLLPLRALPLDAKTAMLALTQAHTIPNLTFKMLLERLPDRTLALTTLWRLIARRRLRTDLSIPITFDSRLYST